jgi:hypothetical protein
LGCCLVFPLRVEHRRVVTRTTTTWEKERTAHPIDDSQRKAARAVGLAYLFGFIALFNEVYVREILIVRGNPGETARNIIAHEQLFRLGMAADLLVFTSIVVVLAGSYVVLRPISRGLALLGASWRLLEASTAIMMTLSSFYVLRLLGRIGRSGVAMPRLPHRHIHSNLSGS